MSNHVSTPAWKPKAFEPEGLTLADLVALVGGAALVLALPTLGSYWPRPYEFRGLMKQPKWLPYVWAFRQNLTGACLMLLPIVLARRARYGGVARPAEFLASCCGIPLVVGAVEIFLVRSYALTRHGFIVPGPGLDGIAATISDEWRDGPQWTFKYCVLLTSAVAAVAFFLGRRRLPGWFLTALLLTAWVGIYWTLPDLTRGANHLIFRAIGVTIGEGGWVVIYFTTKRLPTALLFAVPALLALRSIRRVGPPRPTWLEWTSLGLAVTLFIIEKTREHVQSLTATRSRPYSFALDDLSSVLSVPASALLGLWLIRWLGPVWSRQVGPENGEGGEALKVVV